MPFEDLSLLIAAFIASLFGQGGGALYTPVQVWFGVDFHTAAATSLFLILVISLSSTLIFRRAHEVDWGMALALEVPTTLGAFAGGMISHFVPDRGLGLLLAALLGGSAWFMVRHPAESGGSTRAVSSSGWIWQRSTGGNIYRLDLRLAIPVMLALGLVTSMVGIGGGILQVPAMVLLFGVPMAIAVGSSAFMVGVTAVGGLCGHLSVGHFDWHSAVVLAIPVFIGGQIGSRISVRMDQRRLQLWFGVFLFLVAAWTAILALKSA